jgi:Protein of unknown function (DUF3455)
VNPPGLVAPTPFEAPLQANVEARRHRGGASLQIQRRGWLIVGLPVAASALMGAASAQVPDSSAAPGETVVATVHAEGAQVYECKADAGGRLGWQFREPIATLLLDGETVGRHYAGPNWEHRDGSAVVGKVVARAPGATPEDIPWLKLEISERRGGGVLSGVTTVHASTRRVASRKAHATGPRRT